MKKLILIILCLFLTIGCNKKDDIVNDNNEENKQEVTKVEDTYIDDNPIKVGLYMDGKLINEYNTTIVDGEDIPKIILISIIKCMITLITIRLVFILVLIPKKKRWNLLF